MVKKLKKWFGLADTDSAVKNISSRTTARGLDKSTDLRRQLESARANFKEKLTLFEKEHGTYFDRGPILPQSLVQNCRVYAGRDLMLNDLPKSSIVAEIGTDQGIFAKKILETCEPQKLHVVDHTFSRLDYENVRAAVDSGKCELTEGDSSTIISQFPDGYFDWIYIDGDHSYQGVQKDIKASLPKLKPHGLLAFNDYAVWSPVGAGKIGVSKAVNEFIVDNGWTMDCLALQPAGYFDVVLSPPTD